MSKAKAATEEWLAMLCDCGNKLVAHLKHYDVVRCECGRLYWALQPKRDGQLTFFPYPTKNATP
jgi:hypothetical protein